MVSKEKEIVKDNGENMEAEWRRKLWKTLDMIDIQGKQIGEKRTEEAAFGIGDPYMVYLLNQEVKLKQQLQNMATFAPTERVRSAIEATPTDYLRSTIEQRSIDIPGHAGSYIHKSPNKIMTHLLTSTWKETTHEYVCTPARVYHTNDMTGTYGMIALSDLSEEIVLEVDDRKDTGMASLVYRIDQATGQLFQLLNQVSVWLITGPGDDGKDIIWTFHPGEPVPVTQTLSEDFKEEQITVHAARKLGMVYAKVCYDVAPNTATFLDQIDTLLSEI